ncbi:MAG: outer membrane lipid asymmetry maintenance protein MlaD [Rhodobacteraceae bacterium]|nr:outer membrane lipid asymmetry maintenance protein MlaD [Paracoccaceae bacterium]
MISENRFELLVGLAVLILSGGFLIYLLQLEPSLNGEGSYEVKAKFQSAQGVSVGTDVRLAGVKIGTIESMTLDSDDYSAELILQLRSGIQIPDDSLAAIASASLLGGHFIEITPGGSLAYLQDGDYLYDTQSYVGLIQLLTNFFFSQ